MKLFAHRKGGRDGKEKLSMQLITLVTTARTTTERANQEMDYVPYCTIQYIDKHVLKKDPNCNVTRHEERHQTTCKQPKQCSR